MKKEITKRGGVDESESMETAALATSQRGIVVHLSEYKRGGHVTMNVSEISLTTCSDKAVTAALGMATFALFTLRHHII